MCACAKERERERERETERETERERERERDAPMECVAKTRLELVQASNIHNGNQVDKHTGNLTGYYFWTHTRRYTQHIDTDTDTDTHTHTHTVLD